MATLIPINPKKYISSHSPVMEKVLDSSKWFLTETIEINIGEWSGRPTKEIMLRSSMLSYYFANGWYIDAVMGSNEGGNWISAAVAEATQTGSAKSSSTASSSSASSSSTSSSSSVPGEGHAASSVDTSNASGSGQSASTGQSSSNGSSDTVGTSTSTVTSDGSPWWYAYQRLRLRRRKLQSELVLKDMIKDFTEAYNEGRKVNNDRYEELVSLYALMLQRTEEEAGSDKNRVFTPEDFKPLADAVVKACKEAMEKFGSSVENLPDDWLKSRIDAINLKFDNLIATTKTEMVTKGTYNSTVWPTTESGIERDRQMALNSLKDDMVTLKVDTYGKIASMTADVGNKLMDCEVRIIEAMNKMTLEPTELRNNVFKWMLDFMERREDDYPGLDQLAGITERLGYSDGATGGAGGAH